MRKYEPTDCKLCGGSGWMTAYRIDDPSIEFGFWCHCDAQLFRNNTDPNSKMTKAKSWRDAAEDPTLIPRRLTGEGHLEWDKAIRDWQIRTGIRKAACDGRQ